MESGSERDEMDKGKVHSSMAGKKAKGIEEGERYDLFPFSPSGNNL